MKSVEHRRRLETVDEAEELPHCCCCCRIPQIGRARKRSRVENYSNAAANQDDDPRYQFFLKHLKGNQQSYLLEYKRQGRSVVIKYEGGLHEEHAAQPQQPQPRRVLRSDTTRKKDEPPKTEEQTRNSSQSNSTSENPTVRKLSNNRQKIQYRIMDPDYLTFLEGDTAMSIYDKHAVDSNEEPKQQQPLNSDCSSDVEIVERPPVLRVRSQNLQHKGASPPQPAVNHRRKNSNMITSLQSEFRKQIINLLVKPYDEKEYQRLKFDICIRKPEARHLDLRNGRERSCPKNIQGKCYLDYHADLKEKLSEYEVDKPRCLNLMRGYFFWVQNVARMGSFQPWRDPECLAVRPARGLRYF